MVSNDEMRVTFILRLWREPDAPAGEWRGEVVHVQAGRTARTGDLAAIFAVIRGELTHLERQDTTPDALPP